MYKVNVFLRALLLMAASVSFFSSVSAQGYINYESIGESRLVDELGNQYGSGNMQVVSGGYNIPLSVKKNDRGQLKAWSANISAAYARFENYGEAKALNPDDVLNAGVVLMYNTPISKRWSLMAMVGAGIYAPTDGTVWVMPSPTGGL